MAKTLRILISGQDNNLPVVMVTTLRLKKGTNKILTPLELGVFDVDTADEDVVFTITQVPLHGNLLYNLSRIVTRFSQSDLKKGLISYQHDGSETFSDSLIFTVSDGLHQHFYIPGSDMPVRTPQEMDIEIIPMSSGAPRVVVNTGSNFLTNLTNGLGFHITNRNLKSQDYDSPDDALRYMLTVGPHHGFLQNTAQGGGAIAMWTQGDIDAWLIQYILSPGENATSDSFFFKVTDQEGHSLENQPFHLQWAWLSFKTDSYHGNETDGYIDVTLQRRGYLGETSLVTVEVHEKTASFGTDVSRQFAQMIQFNPGQKEKQWRLAIKDDNVFEGEEILTLQLANPLSAVLEHPYVAMVTLHDAEDEAKVYFEGLNYQVMENASHIDIPIMRTGDISQELTVICLTRDGTARGSPTSKIEPFSDFITRPADHSSIVRFARGDSQNVCRVMLLNDSLYESQKRFYMVLKEPVGGKLGSRAETEITILPDPADEPVFYFDQAHYTVDESAGTLEVKVWKTGTDLSKPSSITVHSQRMGNNPAEVGLDYLPVTRILDFSPGEMTKTLKVAILDDSASPQLEGQKTLELYFRIPVGGRVGQPSTAVVTIDDSVSDLPKMQFKAAEYRVLESDLQVVAKVTRSGDISSQSEVRCYTRPITAKSDVDFMERPDSEDSLVVFLPGQIEADCHIQLVDDTVQEREESFRLVLGTPDSLLPGGATLGGQVTTHIVVDDPEDNPIIMFELNQYTVNEPIIKGDVTIARISVVRLGDTEGTSVVQVTTRSGSALAGKDFRNYDRALNFGPGVSHQTVELEILYDMSGEDREMFTVHMSEDTQRIAQVRHDEAVVYIDENSKLADIKLPLAPLIVSLRDLDLVARDFKRRPIQGYPLVCVSSCSPYHPQYLSVQDVCREAGIDDPQTKFRWRVGQAGGVLFDLDSDTIFTTTRGVTLDSVYFTAGSQVECYARAVNFEGEPGIEVASPVMTVDQSQGACPSSTDSVKLAEPFGARMRYTGPDDEWHPNKVRVRVQIPHTDGMLPVISTRKMANFELTLNDDGSHKNKHQCTNLLKSGGMGAGFGVNHHDLMGFYGSSLPYQYSDTLRSNRTLALYRNLDMSSCVWTFDAYYNMSELVSMCGALMDTDSRMPGSPQSFVVVKLPLFVSYLYFTPGMRDTWRAHEVSRYLTLKFVYGTGTMWDQAIQSNRHPAGLKAEMFPSGVLILADGQLVVRFQTVPKFRGQFLASHPGNQFNSNVQSLSHGGLTFDLQLLPGPNTSDRPHQNWLVTSDTALKDYSGDFVVTLLPCLLTFTQTSTQPISCSPSDNVTFSLPIRLQQVSDPVPSKFSLNTEFRVTRKSDVWLSEKLSYISEDDMTITPGDTVYGRLDVSPIQSLDRSVHLYIEKVFMCAGQRGYIPLYNPDIGHYGCVGNSEQLDTVIRILDIEDPSSVNATFQGVPLSAKMAHDDTQSSDVFNIPGADGFSFDSSPLFQTEDEKLWFLHIVFSQTATNGDVISRTSMFDSHNVRRSLDDIAGVGNGEKGTNMAPLILNFNGKSLKEDQYQPGKKNENSESQMPLIAALIGASVLLLIGIIVLVIYIRHRRKQTSPPPTPSGTITVLSTSPGLTKVISNAYVFKPHPLYHSEV